MELLSYLESALNGLRKRRSAAKISLEVRRAWAKVGTEESRARSREKWLRMVVISERFTTEAFEYFVPENPGPEGIAVYYELVAMPNGAGKPRRFHLEMSNTVRRFYVLREKFENGGGQWIHYDFKPELREVIRGLVKKLEPKR